MRNSGKFSQLLATQKCLNFKRKVERRENSDLVKEAGYKAAKNEWIYPNPMKTLDTKALSPIDKSLR